MKKLIKSQYAPFYDCPAIMKEFLDYMLTIKGRSPKTVDGYYIELRTFLRYLKLSQSKQLDATVFQTTEISDLSLDSILHITLSDVYSYLNFVTTEFQVGASSRSRKISAMRQFYNYITNKTIYLKENPLKDLELPSKRKSLPKYLSLEQSNQLLDSSEIVGSPRDVCILTLFLNCGMRLSELVGIDTNDIRWEDTSLKLLGKGNKERIVYLNEACLLAIKAYLEDTKDIKRFENALFVTVKGNRLTPRRVQQIIEQQLKAAGLGGLGYSPHKLRHTAATLLYQYGNVDVRILKEILGHANLSTTEIYTHVSNKQLEKAANASPLSSRTIKSTDQ